MNVLVVVGVVILAVAYFVWKLLEQGAHAVSDLTDSIGRSSLGRRASIPAVLEKPFPPPDPEREALESYHPTPSAIRALAPVRFVGRTQEILQQRGGTSRTLNIADVFTILKISVGRPYDALFAHLAPRYPVEQPASPRTPSPPPAWTAWTTSIPDPTFDPPYYSGWRTIFNPIVDNAHSKEFLRIQAAKPRRADVLARTKARNQFVRSLADEADARWEEAKAQQAMAFDAVAREHSQNALVFTLAALAEKATVATWRNEVNRPGVEGLMSRIDLTLRLISLPDAISREGEARFDRETGILIHEHRFPDLATLTWAKLAHLKAGPVFKAPNQKEVREAVTQLYPALCLRLAVEIARLDTDALVQAVAVNGWVDYTDKSTGQPKRAYCASLFASKEQIQALSLGGVDPVLAFGKLKGITGNNTRDTTPIAPIVRLDTTDPRFVDAKEVLSHLGQGENLAAMGWEDFEHLCRELFERAFASAGAEVKVTQASRDQGVDAVVFDPDPLRGGRIIVQAKRYTNLVDVSAVRDLYGTVINEGAVKGILVTTSSFGPDSYSFAKGKPLTLINGREMLGMLERFGYTFRIDLVEAKRIMNEQALDKLSAHAPEDLED